ncbi:myosin-16-like isoform X2 [Mangifera indica]|uniref:myosin-16-like isoform X2 n=1 Tax=Mangifera indica TaxID=29780 RepID=UPI001CF9979B|nr:myosin-16-like isoform X2 [Mangifera indica]
MVSKTRVAGPLSEGVKVAEQIDETFGQKFYQTFKNNKRYINPKLSCTNFTTFQYVGELTYLADLFLDKNQDYVLAVHQVLLTASKCPFVAGLLKSHLNHPLGHALRFKGDVSMCVYG